MGEYRGYANKKKKNPMLNIILFGFGGLFQYALYAIRLETSQCRMCKLVGCIQYTPPAEPANEHPSADHCIWMQLHYSRSRSSIAHENHICTHHPLKSKCFPLTKRMGTPYTVRNCNQFIANCYLICR